MEVSVQHHAPAPLPTGNKPGTHRIGGLLVPTASLDVWRGQKTLPLPELHPRASSP
jgi:hypothetical protein